MRDSAPAMRPASAMAIVVIIILAIVILLLIIIIVLLVPLLLRLLLPFQLWFFFVSWLGEHPRRLTPPTNRVRQALPARDDFRIA